MAMVWVTLSFWANPASASRVLQRLWSKLHQRRATHTVTLSCSPASPGQRALSKHSAGLNRLTSLRHEDTAGARARQAPEQSSPRTNHLSEHTLGQFFLGTSLKAWLVLLAWILNVRKCCGYLPGCVRRDQWDWTMDTPEAEVGTGYLMHWLETANRRMGGAGPGTAQSDCNTAGKGWQNHPGHYSRPPRWFPAPVRNPTNSAEHNEAAAEVSVHRIFHHLTGPVHNLSSPGLSGLVTQHPQHH